MTTLESLAAAFWASSRTARIAALSPTKSGVLTGASMRRSAAFSRRSPPCSTARQSVSSISAGSIGFRK